MITCDGYRLTYVGPLGAFSVCRTHTFDEMYAHAIDGCATLEAAETALSECVGYLEWLVCLTEEEVA